MHFALSSIVYFCSTATRSAKKKESEEGNETDKEFDGIDPTPPSEKKKPAEAKKKRTENMSSKDDPSNPHYNPAPNMSAGAAKAAADATPALLFSGSDADIDLDDWKAEDVYLGAPYEKKIDFGTHKVRWTAYPIIVLTHSEEDKEAVGAFAITEKGVCTKVRITKPRIPSIFRGGIGETVIGNLLAKNRRAAESFGENVYNDNNDPHTIVDVSFPKPVRKIVTPMNNLHLGIESGHTSLCKCGICQFREIQETVNAVAYEIEEVEVRQTAGKKSKKKRATCRIDESE